MPSLLILLGAAFAVFAAIMLLLVASGVFGTTTGRHQRTLSIIEAYGAVPQSMKDELEPGFKDRILFPSLNRLNKLGRRLTPADTGSRLRAKLDAAGNPPGMNADRLIGMMAAGFVGGLFTGLVISLVLGLSVMPSVALGVGLALLGYLAPSFWLYQKAYDRRVSTQQTLPDALDLLTISVEAGLGFDAAVAHVAKSTDGPLAEELSRLLQEMQLGSGRVEALRALGERSTLPELKSFVTAMVQADAFGIPIGRVLRVQSTEMRNKRRQRAEEQAQKVPVKILFPLMFCILPTLFIIVMGPGVITMMESFR